MIDEWMTYTDTKLGDVSDKDDSPVDDTPFLHISSKDLLMTTSDMHPRPFDFSSTDNELSNPTPDTLTASANDIDFPDSMSFEGFVL